MGSRTAALRADVDATAIEGISRSEYAPRVAPVRAPAPDWVCIFGESWWLDAVTGGNWDKVIVERDGAAIAEMRFQMRRRLGLRFVSMPMLTRTLSPRLENAGGRPVTQRVEQISLIADLIARLPSFDRLEMCLEPGCPSALGFVQSGFAVTHTYTFRGAAGASADQMLELAHKKTRNVIAKAQSVYETDAGTDVERFLRLHQLEFSLGSTIDYEAVRRVVAAAVARGRAQIIFASRDGADRAAAILVWDQSTLYYWLTAREAGQGGANSLLIHQAMRAAAERGLVLDLDGYATEASGLFLLKFGLEPVVRPYVNSSSALWRGLNWATTAFQPKRFDRRYRV